MTTLSAGCFCSRRRFLASVGVMGAALPLLQACGPDGGSVQGPTGIIAAGNASNYALNTVSIVSGQALAIGHDAGGFYAMTLICTHQGCDIATDGIVNAAGITCNCHGSQFDANGAVTMGPAGSPLEHFLVTIDATTGNITVDASQTVSATTRA